MPPLFYFDFAKNFRHARRTVKIQPQKIMPKFKVTFPANFPSTDIRSFQAMLVNAGGYWWSRSESATSEIECTRKTAQWLVSRWSIAAVSISPIEMVPAPAQDFARIPSESDLRGLIQLDSREG